MIRYPGIVWRTFPFMMLAVFLVGLAAFLRSFIPPCVTSPHECAPVHWVPMAVESLALIVGFLVALVLVRVFLFQYIAPLIFLPRDDSPGDDRTP